MALFPANDPRQPTNKCHTIYLAVLEAVGVGKRVNQAQWRSILQLGTGAIGPRQLENYTEAMENLLMISRHGHDGIEIRPDALALIGAVESSDTA